ncbi:hypothetical protein AK812_SmicGene10445 [Symbiodinium microadriaticum]|uniref:Alpha-type protein kinase domain-containing protein n=1 Tax=Symbiodinium microadriaticum TaxID=2951 RepID=A0A1Q9EFW5_SYMMI|nr:hypothetical protein AK812_SmicGene10445 [Symbiodinium microadriaticum]
MCGRPSHAVYVATRAGLPIVSIVVPFWCYLLGLVYALSSLQFLLWKLPFSFAVKLLSQLATDHDEGESDEESWADADVVGELPALLGKPGGGVAKPTKQKPDTSRPRHIVLVLDASGSMRQQDVEADAETRRELGSQCASLTRPWDGAGSHTQPIVSIVVPFWLEAAELCAAKFAREHAKARPQDFFSAVAFHETATAVSKKLLAGDFAETFALGDRAANGTFYLQGLQEAADVLAEYADLPGELVMLSDGRPADTKAALNFFQAPLTFLARKQKPQLRVVDFELPEQGIFGKKHVIRYRAARTHFSFDGTAFQQKKFAAGPVVRRQLPYMRGGMRLVYSFQDDCVSKDGTWMVAKSSRYLDAALNSRVAVEAKSSALASYFASLFNSRLQNSGAATAKPATLFFVPCYLYEVENAVPDVPTCFAAERYLPGVFLKYNSNNGYVADAQLPHNDLVQAFLHFSFEEPFEALQAGELRYRALGKKT